MRYKYLSYPVLEGMPVYGGKANIGIKAIRAISQNDSVNVYRFSMESHWGTHVDAPRHFFENGNSIGDYPARAWVFETPEIINVSLKPAEILRLGDWVKKIRPSVDIVLFKSGWSHFRKDKKYVYKNPGVHPEVGVYLRKNFRKLRAVGIDWISVSPANNKVLGRSAHRAFLDPQGKGNSLLIVEDMRLSGNLYLLKSIIISPLIISGADSSPCTILGVFYD